MSKNLTEESLAAIASARETARSLHHTCLGTEHILAGIVRTQGGATPRVFERLGLDGRALWTALLAVAPRVLEPPKNRYLPLSARLVAALEAAARAARDLERPRIAPEHLLLGLLSEESSTACRVLDRMGLERGRVRGETLAVMGEVRGLERAAPVARSIAVRVDAPVPPAQLPPIFLCPRGHGVMEKLRGPDGIEIGLCPECLGTFVPAGQLAKLAARAASGTLDDLFERSEG
jgi:ATP-dependent Clp protease ATP-binding subunit ClpA